MIFAPSSRFNSPSLTQRAVRVIQAASANPYLCNPDEANLRNSGREDIGSRFIDFVFCNGNYEPLSLAKQPRLTVDKLQRLLEIFLVIIPKSKGKTVTQRRCKTLSAFIRWCFARVKRYPDSVDILYKSAIAQN